MSLLRKVVAPVVLSPYEPGISKMERALRQLRSQRGSLIAARLREKRDPILEGACEFWCRHSEGELVVSALIAAAGGEP